MYAPDNLCSYIAFKEINNQISQAIQDNTMVNVLKVAKKSQQNPSTSMINILSIQF